MGVPSSIIGVLGEPLSVQRQVGVRRDGLDGRTGKETVAVAGENRDGIRVQEREVELRVLLSGRRLRDFLDSRLKNPSQVAFPGSSWSCSKCARGSVPG